MFREELVLLSRSQGKKDWTDLAETLGRCAKAELDLNADSLITLEGTGLFTLVELGLCARA